MFFFLIYMSHIFSFLYFPCLQKMPEFRFSSIIKNFTLILTPICFIELICLLPNLASSLCCKSFCFNCTAAIWSSYSFKFKLSNVKWLADISKCLICSILVLYWHIDIDIYWHIDIWVFILKNICLFLQQYWHLTIDSLNLNE